MRWKSHWCNDMTIDYSQAFGLSDNPFGPYNVVTGIPAALTRNLQARPLYVHRNANLGSLYCEKLSAFDAACSAFDLTLNTIGYRSATNQRGTSPVLVTVEGDRGAGKTTLASRLMQIIMRRQPVGQSPWELIELTLDAASETATEQAAKISGIEKKLLDEKPEYCCILVDDLRADAYRFALQMYDKLVDTIAALFLTSSDGAFGAQVAATRQTVQSFKIPRLTSADAVAFISHRYSVFQVPPPALPTAPLFPFDAADIGAAVAAQVFNGNVQPGPVTIRLIGTLLRASLDQRLHEINRTAQPFDVRQLQPNQIPANTIQLAQSYRTLVFT
jgi:hypothetical protein